jgi:hypothetical protein
VSDRTGLGLYALAWALLLVALISLVMSLVGFLESRGLLIVSAVFSGLAIVSSVTGVLLPRRR